MPLNQTKPKSVADLTQTFTSINKLSSLAVHNFNCMKTLFEEKKKLNILLDEFSKDICVLFYKVNMITLVCWWQYNLMYMLNSKISKEFNFPQIILGFIAIKKCFAVLGP